MLKLPRPLQAAARLKSKVHVTGPVTLTMWNIHRPEDKIAGYGKYSSPIINEKNSQFRGKPKKGKLHHTIKKFTVQTLPTIPYNGKRNSVNALYNK